MRPEHRIGSHEATILALVLNELISNAILHGFAGLHEGALTVRGWLSNKDIEGQHPQKSSRPLVNVTVSDNGTGLPGNFDPQRSANLGLSLVRNLVTAELRGEFSITKAAKGRGTVAHLTFPLPRARIAFFAARRWLYVSRPAASTVSRWRLIVSERVSRSNGLLSNRWLLYRGRAGGRWCWPSAVTAIMGISAVAGSERSCIIASKPSK